MAVDTADKRFSMMGLSGVRVMPTPSGDFDSIGDRAQLLGLYRGIGASSPGSVTYHEVGAPFLYTEDHWRNASIHLEGYLAGISGTARADLYDATIDAAVADSQIASGSATHTRVRSAPLTLVDGHSYMRRLGVTAASSDVGNVIALGLMGVPT